MTRSSMETMKSPSCQRSCSAKALPNANMNTICRNNFMGVIPKELRNVYFIGFMRPTTGGLNNITEMQCLFTHKMITDRRFNDEMYRTVENRIEKYNKHYYPLEKRGPLQIIWFTTAFTRTISRDC